MKNKIVLNVYRPDKNVCGVVRLSEEAERRVKKIKRETGLAALIATHNMELAARMNRQFKLKDGILEDSNEPLFAKVRKNFY